MNKFDENRNGNIIIDQLEKFLTKKMTEEERQRYNMVEDPVFRLAFAMALFKKEKGHYVYIFPSGRIIDTPGPMSFLIKSEDSLDNKYTLDEVVRLAASTNTGYYIGKFGDEYSAIVGIRNLERPFMGFRLVRTIQGENNTTNEQIDEFLLRDEQLVDDEKFKVYYDFLKEEEIEVLKNEASKIVHERGAVLSMKSNN